MSNKFIDDLPRKEVYAQLIAILSNRRRNEEGDLLIGIDDPTLKEILEMNNEEMHELMGTFNKYIMGLGLTTVEYQYKGYVWYALKSMYSAPIELTDDELAILGAIIMFFHKEESQQIEFTELVNYIIQRNFYTEFKVKKLIQSLQSNGYIERKGRMLEFGPRALIEFSEEAREQIAAQAAELLF
jgi:hypothetical protein